MSRARRFLEAFACAVHDVSLEQNGYDLYHFFDSDFLHRVIFGFRDGLNHSLLRETKSGDLQSIAGQRLLMGALVGQRIGAPPSMRALPPHLYEIRLAVERPWPAESRSNFDATVELLDLRDLLADLRRDLDASEPDRVLDCFLDHGPPVFYGIELLSGAWESRLGRLLSLHVHEDSPFDYESEVVAGSGFDVIARCVGEVGDAARRQGNAASGLRDTMALSMLARAVDEAGHRDPPFPLARFYTETPRILNAWRDRAEFRSLLTYEARDHHTADLDGVVHGVVRTSYYYLIRALMPELGYGRQSPTLGADTDTSAVVYGIGRDLADAAEELRKGGLSDAELGQFRVGGSTLGQYMTEVTELSSYGTAWRRLMATVPRGLPAELVNELQKVITGEQRRGRELQASFRKHVKSLSARTRDVAAYTETYVHILDALSRFSGALHPAAGGYGDDFGLNRWGFSVDDEDELALRHLVDSYEEWIADRHVTPAATSAHGRSAWHSFIITIAYRLHDIRSVPFNDVEHLAEVMALLGFLWRVGDYSSVTRYGEILIQGIQQRIGTHSGDGDGPDRARLESFGGATENMVVAAQVRDSVGRLGGLVGSERELQSELVASVLKAVDRLDVERRRFPTTDAARAITQGYLLFHTWQHVNRSIIARSASRPGRARSQELAERSLRICMDALARYDASTPMYVLLMNHCVYVAAVAGLTHDGGDREIDLARDLMLYRTLDSNSWSYRFDDTLGYYFYARAARAVRTLRDADADESRLILSARKDIEAAKRWFACIPDNTGDSDVTAHRGLLREIEADLERFL